MAKNAGMDEYSVNGFVSDQPQHNNPFGYNFKTKLAVNDMFEEGIIDPFKVVRLALESATAIASSLVSIETAIVNEDKEDAK